MNDPGLHQDVGHLEGKLESLEKSVERLTDKVEVLTGVLDQGRGARMAALAFLWLGTAFISIVSSVLTFFGMRFTHGGN